MNWAQSGRAWGHVEVSKRNFEAAFGHAKCSRCGEEFWARRARLNDGKPVFCPNGHECEVVAP